MVWYNPLTWGRSQTDEEISMSPTPPRDVTIPWVHIKGIVHDNAKGVQIELDWNDAFVQYLRAGGITGASDDAVVQKYLAMLHRQMLDSYADNGGDTFE